LGTAEEEDQAEEEVGGLVLCFAFVNIILVYYVEYI
jgi:hypothetical protein